MSNVSEQKNISDSYLSVFTNVETSITKKPIVFSNNLCASYQLKEKFDGRIARFY